jgi:DUF4097 and DUF4098 domain-containing protein YvlB
MVCDCTNDRNTFLTRYFEALNDSRARRIKGVSASLSINLSCWRNLMKFLVRPSFCVLSTLFVVTNLAVAEVSKTEEYSYELKEGGRISLSNVNGDVSITGTDGRQVSIVATKKADNQKHLDDMKIEIDATENTIRIETRHPDRGGGILNWGGDDSGSVEYKLTVPHDVEIDSLETVNSDVAVNGVSGPISAESVNGKLHVTGASSDLSAETVNGSIDVEFLQLGSGQRVSADAVNGRIVLRLPADASARVTAETLNGSIDADDFELQPDSGFVGNGLDGQIGGGDARVAIDTVNGSITIKKRD